MSSGLTSRLDPARLLAEGVVVVVSILIAFWLDAWWAEKELEREDFIGGRDLIALGMTPGKEMGKILATIRTAQDNQRIQSRKDAIEMAKAIIEQSHKEGGL